MESAIKPDSQVRCASRVPWAIQRRTHDDRTAPQPAWRGRPPGFENVGTRVPIVDVIRKASHPTYAVLDAIPGLVVATHRAGSASAHRVTSEDRKAARVSHEVFDELDEILGTKRGPDGRPSVNDFLTHDLITIVDTFATRFDELPELIQGRLDYRILVTTGTLVYAFAVIGPLTADGSVEIISIDLDFEA